MAKAIAFQKLRFTGRLYNYTEVSDSTATNIRVYSFSRVIILDVQQTVFGKLNIIFDDDADDIMQRARIEVLRDSDGNEVYPGGIWELQGVMPILNSFGKREGFRSVAQLALQTLPNPG